MRGVRSLAGCLLLNLLAGSVAVGTISSPQRVVVIGDIHADLEVARKAFRLAGAIDENDTWVGGELIVVQLGDLIGRSYEDREVLDFVLAVREEAASAGGRVIVVIGNHEVFGARLELRWVHDAAFAAFDGTPDLDLDDPRVSHLPANKRARSAALMPGGYYSRQLADFPAVLRIGKTIYVHGGVTPHWAEYGIDRINNEVRNWFAGNTGQPESTYGMDPGNFNDSVMMSRHFSRDVSEEDCTMLDDALSILDAERMVVAHSVQESITARCDDQVWAIDIGMSRYYGGKVQVLEIIDDDVVNIIDHVPSN